MNILQRLSIGTCLLLTLAMAIAGCKQQPMSICKNDATKGRNGSFEHSSEGLPINWCVYTPATVPSGDFDLLLDTTDAKEGKQSLKFVVRQCAATGGWYSPGMAQQLPAQAGETYKIGFWIKSQGAKFRVNVGGVSAKHGVSRTILESSEDTGGWKYYEDHYTIAGKMDAIRLELNILQPGTLWVDQVTIDRE